VLHAPTISSSLTWRTTQVMKLLIMQFSPPSYHFIPLRAKYSPQHPVLKHPQVYVLPLMSETKFHTHTEQFIWGHCQYLDCIMSSGTMIHECWIRKNLEKSDSGQVEVPFRHIPGGTENNHEKPQSGQPTSQQKLEPCTLKIHVLSITGRPAHSHS
jgi:hypothetical protein